MRLANKSLRAIPLAFTCFSFPSWTRDKSRQSDGKSELSMDLLQDVDKLVWKQEEQKAILTYSLVVKYLFNLHLVVYFTDVCGVPMTDDDLN